MSICEFCGKNQAPIKRPKTVNGKTVEVNCCYECAKKLDEQIDKAEITVCSYCGMTAKEFESKKLVGCAHCYQQLKDTVGAAIEKMQYTGTHTGKKPVWRSGDGETLSEAEIIQRRVERQSYELELIIEKLTREGKFEEARDYADKRSLIRADGEGLEDFVWRNKKNG